MEKDKQNDEEQTLEQLQEQLKKMLFKITDRVLKHEDFFNQYIFYFLITIQSLQILWFSIHPLLTFLKNSIALPQFLIGLQYLNFENAMRTDNTTWPIFLIVTFLIIVIHVITTWIGVCLLRKQQVSETAEIVSKILNIQILLFNTVFTIPFFNVAFNVLYCNPTSVYHLNESCYSPTYIIYCIMAAIILIVMLLESLFWTFVFYIKNPFDRSTIATPSNFYYVGKILLKILPSIYFMIDVQSSYVNVYIFALTIVLGGYIFLFRIFSRHTYVEKYHYFVYCCQLVIFWFSLINILEYFLSTPGVPDLSFVYTVAGSLPLCYCFVQLQKESKKKIFLQGIRNLKKNKQVAQEFIFMLIDIILNSQTHKKKIQLLGFIKIHNSGCQKESGCNCHAFLEDFFKRKKLTIEEQTNRYYEFLKFLLEDYIKKYSSMTIFKITYAYLLFYKLERKIQSIHYLSQTLREKISFSEQFLIYRLKLKFEEESKEKENDLTQDKGHAVKIYLQFNNYFLKLQEQIEICAKNNLEYWRELTQDSPSVLKLWNLSKLFEIQIGNIKKLYDQIIQIYPNNIMTLVLYSNFVKFIVGNHKQYEKLLEKIKSQKTSEIASSKEGNQMKFRENSNLCILSLTTSTENMGNIVSCNSEIQKILQYTKNQITGQKITKLMPKIYGELHDGFINKYINRPDKEIVSRELSVFALTKKGYIVQCNLMIKLIPEIDQGFRIAGFLKKVQEIQPYTPHFIMYNEQTLALEGISESCEKSLGLTSQSIIKTGNNNQITINYLLPEFKFEDIYANEQLKTEGFQTFLDTRIISDDFVDQPQIEDESESQNKESLKEYQHPVKIFVVSEAVYGKIKLKVLKFFILQEQQQKQKMSDAIASSISKIAGEQINDENDETEINYLKKFRDFVERRQTKILLVILIINVYIFLILEISLISVDLYENITHSNEVSVALSAINQTQGMIVSFGNIDFDSQKLYLTNQLNLTKDSFNYYMQHMNNTLNYLQTNLVDLIRLQIVLKNSYGYTAPKIYQNFSFYNNGSPIIQQFEYTDAVFQFITTGISLTLLNYTTYSQKNLSSSQSTVQNLYFIQQNGLVIFPDLAKNKVQNLTSYFSQRFATYAQSRTIMLVLRIVSIINIFLIIVPIILKLDSINEKLLGIYQTLPLSDILEIQNKCETFIEANFQETVTSKIMKNNKQKTKKDIVVNNQDPLMLQQIDFKQEMAPLSGKNNNGEGEPEKKIPKVRLNQIPNSESQIIFLVGITIFLLGYSVGEYYLHDFFFQPFLQFENQMKILGDVRNYNRFVTVFAQKDIAQNLYGQNLTHKISKLYETIEVLYTNLPDTYNNRQTIYGKVQEMKEIIQNSPSLNSSILTTSIYKQIQKNLQQVQINLNQESINFLSNCNSNITGTFQKIADIKFIIQFLIFLILVKILISNYLQKIKTKTYRSINMALMIPNKIVTKNQQIIKLI